MIIKVCLGALCVLAAVFILILLGSFVAVVLQLWEDWKYYKFIVDVEKVLEERNP